MTIYTLGYASWPIQNVETLVRDLDARLIDVRYKPYTSKPGFSRDDLDDRLGPQYRHEPGFGNVNYRGGPVNLKAPERALDRLDFLGAEDRPPIILMCGCKDVERCHRTQVAARIASRYGGTIEHLPAEPPAGNYRESTR